MLDAKFIRENIDKVKKGIADKQLDTKILHDFLQADQKRRILLQEIEDLRAQKNKFASEKNIEEGKKVKEQLKQKEPELQKVEKEFQDRLMQIPNLPSDDVPVGKDEKENKIIRSWGEPKKFEFKEKDHLELGETLDIIDFERGAKVAGSSFYYLKNEGVLLELALVNYGIEFLAKRGFTPVITPDLAREKFYVGTGYLPKGPEAQTYTINDHDLGLIATSEVTLAGYYSDEVLKEKDLPKKYAGYSHCFRVEAGGYGKYSKGLYRVHQFTKVEMFVYSKLEESRVMHEELVKIEEEFWQSLNISYRVVEMCTGDLGAQAAKKYDIDAWMPGRGDFGEVTSTSNTTDYQARRLNVKYLKGSGTEFVHTLNGTLVAVPRAIIAILENNQQADGSVVVPKVLHKWMGKEIISSI